MMTLASWEAEVNLLLGRRLLVDLHDVVGEGGEVALVLHPAQQEGQGPVGVLGLRHLPVGAWVEVLVQVLLHVRCGAVAGLQVPRDCPQDNPVQIPVHFVVLFGGGRNRLVRDLVHGREVILRLYGRPARQHLIEDEPEGEDVRLRPQPFVREVLRGHVAGRP